MDELLSAYESGIAAVESLAAELTDAEWLLPSPCEGWVARDVAAHCRAVTDWYHEWLDRALDGEDTRPFPESEIDEKNAAALRLVGMGGGPEHVAVFAERARTYADRASGHWSVPMGFPYGTVTVGAHFGLGAVEWHVHAWDIATSAGKDYSPDESQLLLDHLIRTMGPTRPGLGTTASGFAAKVTSMFASDQEKAWKRLLKVSGRKI